MIIPSLNIMQLQKVIDTLLGTQFWRRPYLEPRTLLRHYYPTVLLEL